MKTRLLSLSAAVAMLFSASAFAQHEHSDVEFGYDSLSTPTEIEVEVVEATSDGFAFFEAEFEIVDPGQPGNYFTNEPGFTTNDMEGLLINQDDQVWLQALDASGVSSFGVGYVNYYNPNTDQLEASGRLGVLDNTASTADLILNGGAIESGPNPQFLGLGDSDGDLHDHVVIDLLDDATAPFGAYGVMFQMWSDTTGDGNVDISSDPFWMVWNHGMSDEDFEEFAVAKFGIQEIPEPTSATILLLGAAVVAVRRRR